MVAIAIGCQRDPSFPLMATTDGRAQLLPRRWSGSPLVWLASAYGKIEGQPGQNAYERPKSSDPIQPRVVAGDLWYP